MKPDWTAILAALTATALLIDKLRDALKWRADTQETGKANLFQRARGVVDSQAEQIERLDKRVTDLSERVEVLEDQLSAHRRIMREAGIEPPPLTLVRSP